jgi:hypothetical protein
MDNQTWIPLFLFEIHILIIDENHHNFSIHLMFKNFGMKIHPKFIYP